MSVASTVVRVAIVAVAYPCAILAGRDAAKRDVVATTSWLPTIQSITSVKGGELPYGGQRLLLASKETVICFMPVARPADVPKVNLLRREDVGDIVITR